MLLYTHPACLSHDPGAGHPECPARLEAVLHALRATFPALPWREAPRASRDAVLRVHARALVADVLDTPFEGHRRLDEDTAMSVDSPEAALRAAGAGIAAVDAVMAGESSHAFCAVRPPGHHATGDTAMGFCLFNAVAVAAAHAVHAHGLERVAIADFDVHHGNGSQDIFANEPRVMYASSHQMPLYPDSGRPEERGVGNIANAPLAPGAGSEAFRAAWSRTLLPALEAFSGRSCCWCPPVSMATGWIRWPTWSSRPKTTAGSAPNWRRWPGATPAAAWCRCSRAVTAWRRCAPAAWRICGVLAPERKASRVAPIGALRQASASFSGNPRAPSSPSTAPRLPGHGLHRPRP